MEPAGPESRIHIAHIWTEKPDPHSPHGEWQRDRKHRTRGLSSRGAGHPSQTTRGRPVDSRAMKILVVGSGGVGAAFAPIAARRDFYEHVVFADIDGSRARRVVDRFGTDGRFSATKIDATDAADVAAVAKAHSCD